MNQPSKLLSNPGAKGRLAFIGNSSARLVLLTMSIYIHAWLYNNIDSSENDSDMISSPDCLSDEGIGRNVRQLQGKFYTQTSRLHTTMYAILSQYVAGTQREAIHIHQVNKFRLPFGARCIASHCGILLNLGSAKLHNDSSIFLYTFSAINYTTLTPQLFNIRKWSGK